MSAQPGGCVDCLPGAVVVWLAKVVVDDGGGVAVFIGFDVETIGACAWGARSRGIAARLARPCPEGGCHVQPAFGTLAVKFGSGCEPCFLTHSTFNP